MTDMSLVDLRSLPTLVHLLHWRAKQQPTDIAYTFLQDDDSSAMSISYHALDQRAQALAMLLRQHHQPGERALLLYHPGLEYIVAFFGCLYANMVAVPAYPPRLNRSIQRIMAIVDNAQASVALTAAGTVSAQQQAMLLHHSDSGAHLSWIETQNISSQSSPHNWHLPTSDASTLAFLQYTSGSTGAPKGVMIHYDNLFYNLEVISTAFALNKQSSGVIWLPPYHDMGLIGGILVPLYQGFPCTLMSPASFLQRPLRWLQTISNCSGQVVSGGPNFAYDMCVEHVTAEQMRHLKLDHWQVAFTGAEPIRNTTLEHFSSHFASTGFRHEALYPCYGGAEATLMVSGGSPSTPPVTQYFLQHGLESHLVIPTTTNVQKNETVVPLVGCGKNFPGQKISILHPQTQEKDLSNRVGEIWVTGPGVAHGYWNTAKDTDKTFITEEIDGKLQRTWRTGDLGFMIDDELFVTGRIKDMLIVRGHNYYPQDIELYSAQSHRALKSSSCAAFTAPNNNTGESIVVVQEIDRQYRHMDLDEITQAIRKNVAMQLDLLVDTIIIIKPHSLPRTSSGKISRSACRLEFLAHTLQQLAHSSFDLLEAGVAPRTEISATLLRAYPHNVQAELLERFIKEAISSLTGVPIIELHLQSDLITYCADSLKAVELQHRIEDTLKIALAMKTILNCGTLQDLRDHLQQRLNTERYTTQPLVTTSSTPVQAHTPYPLSYGQQAFWFMYQFDQQYTSYHITQALHLPADVDLSMLRQAFQQLIERHLILRTTFISSPTDLLQHIQDDTRPYMVEQDATSWSEQRLQEKMQEVANTRIDLQKGPLFKIHIFLRENQQHRVVLTMHHSIVDFWSLELLKQDLSALYTVNISHSASALTPLTTSYIDYINWQNAYVTSPQGEQDWQYWKNYLADLPPTLYLPIENAHSPEQKNRRGIQTALFSSRLTEQLSAFSQTQKTTLFTVLMAAFQILIYRYTQQEEFLFGTITAGRSQSDFVDTVGYFANPVALRANLKNNLTFLELLEQVRQTLLLALEHQDFPFALLVERLHLLRGTERTPLFRILFMSQQEHLHAHETALPAAVGIAEANFTLGGSVVTTYTIGQQHTQFDLLVRTALLPDGLATTIEYNSELFADHAIVRLLNHFQQLLGEIVHNARQPISVIPLLSPDEYLQLISEWNIHKQEPNNYPLFNQLFADQAECIPDAIALSDGVQQLTYATLNNDVNRLACHLHQRGVGPDVVVGVYMERSPEMIIALLAILKAGGAYLPLDPHYPQDRLTFMLQDSQAHLLISQQHLHQRIVFYKNTIIDLDTGWQNNPGLTDTTSFATGIVPENLAYLIYTSGSTGQPKGVAVTQSSLANFLSWVHNYYSPQEWSRILAHTSICFDISLLEIFAPLSCGGTIVMANNLLNVADDQFNGTTLLFAVPSVLQELLKHNGLPSTLKTIALAGEVLPESLIRQLAQQLPDLNIDNLYGPTETTIALTVERVDKQLAKPTLGYTSTNTETYILDQFLQPVPIGVIGELYLGGEGLARGYAKRPDLTAERFIPHPFNHQFGKRLYRSGDLVCYTPDGRLDFKGRVDQQVKIRGIRIELGEIEVAVCQFPPIQDCKVIIHENQQRVQHIIAYIILHTGEVLNIEQLRSFLHTKILYHSIPTFFIMLDAFPLLRNGKLNYKALSIPTQKAQASTNFEKAANPEEEHIMRVWSALLDIEHISRHDNFFELGGHSLLATRAVSALRQALQIDLSIHDFFLHATPATLAVHLRDRHAAAQGKDLSPPSSIQRLPRASLEVQQAQKITDMIANISDDEVDTLLQQLLPEVHGQ